MMVTVAINIMSFPSAESSLVEKWRIKKTRRSNDLIMTGMK